MHDAISLHRRGRPHQLETAATARTTKMHGTAPAKSSPIQIPQKRNPMVLYPPYAHAMSPEMLFDMSPESSDPSRDSFSAAASSVKAEPAFHYYIPLNPSSERQNNSESKPTKSSPNSPLSRNDSSGSTDVPNVKHPVSRRGHTLVLDENDLSPEGPSRKSSTTRVTGFHPIKGAQFVGEDQYRPVERLSPGPNWDSFTSSPWILPGRGESSGEEGIACSQVADPHDFKRQLLRRIENQNRPRFAALRSYCA